MVLRIIKPKWNLKIVSVILVAVVLVACGVPPANTASDKTPAINLTDVSGTAWSAAFTSVAETMTAVPTSTAIPTNTATAQLPMPTQTPLPFVTVDGLRVVSAIGDLYLQDSGKQEIRLASNVKGFKVYGKHQPDPIPLISDDGQKIVFYRAGPDNLDSVYSINTDGTGEQLLVNADRLSKFGQTYGENTTLMSLALVPDTHLLLFNTYQHGAVDPEAVGWLPIIGNDLFIVNTDTGAIKQLKAPFQGGNFKAAPNGKWIAVQTLDHIDIMDVQGQMVRRNFITYGKTEAAVVIPMFWTPDSNELIILPSGTPLFAAGATVGRGIWRYPINGDPGFRVKLNPPPVYDYYAVSPDGNWIAYVYDTENDPVANPDVPFGFYVGNLHDGTSHLISEEFDFQSQIFAWSPDSVHFLFNDMEDSMHVYMGSIYGEITFLEQGDGIVGWVDNNRFLTQSGLLGEIGKPGLSRVIDFSIRPGFGYPIAFVYLGH